MIQARYILVHTSSSNVICIVCSFARKFFVIDQVRMTEIVFMMVMCPPVGDGIVSTVRRGKTTSAVVETLIKMEIAYLENAPICSHRTHAWIVTFITQTKVQNWLFINFLSFQDKIGCLSSFSIFRTNISPSAENTTRQKDSLQTSDKQR